MRCRSTGQVGFPNLPFLFFILCCYNEFMNEAFTPEFGKNINERILVPFLPEHEVLRNKLKDLEGSLSDKDFLQINEDISNFSEKLEGKYPDCRRRQIFHALIGSGMDSTINITEDFPGEDSVEEFIKKLIIKYNKKPE